MGLGKPSGSDEMLEPGGWPDADEDAFRRVGDSCTHALQTLRKNSTTPWNRQIGDTFHNGGGHWTGNASGAAETKGGTLNNEFTSQEQLLTRAANWNYNTAGVIGGAKNRITTSLLQAWEKINAVKPTDEDAQTQIDNIKKQYLKIHQGIVDDAAQNVQTPDTYHPDHTEHELLNKDLSTNQPPVGALPGTPPGKAPETRGGTEGTGPQRTPTPPGGSPMSTPSTGTTPVAGGPNTRGETSASQEQHKSQQGNTGDTNPATETRGGTNPNQYQNQSAQGQVPNQAVTTATNPSVPSGPPGAVAPPSGTRATGGGGGGTATGTSSGSGSPASGLGGSPSSTGTPQSGNPAGQQTGAQQPGGPGKNPLQQGLQQFNQGLQNTAGQTSQPLASAQPATAQPTTPAPAAPAGAAGGASGTNAAPVGAASAAGGGGSVGGPAAATPAAPAAPLGPAPTPSPAAPVAQPGPGGPAGPAVAAAGTNSQQAAAAAAPIPVSPARAERDALAAAAKAGLLQRKSAGNTDADIEIARRVSAALHAPPSIPAASYQFVWAVGVTSEGQILAANSYGIGYIPDGVKLPGQVTLVSADEAIPPAERARWVNFPFLALQGWAQFHGKTLRAIIGTPEEVKPYKSSTHAEELAPDDIPADGTMQGRSRLQVIAPDAAARLEEWSDVTLYEALPPRPVQDAPPDAKQTTKLWMGAIQPLLRTTGTNGPIDHLTKLIAYADHMQSIELYKAYTAPHVAAQREAMSDWIYWQHISSICQDATNPVLGGVQA